VCNDGMYVLRSTETRPFGSPWLNPGGGWLTRWRAPKWRTLPPVGNTGIDDVQLWRVNSLSLAIRLWSSTALLIWY
jgi:hypothetical protein